MFVFGSEIDGEFVFCGTGGHIYMFPNEDEARKSWGSAKTSTHLYEVDPDLGLARFVAEGDNMLEAPLMVEPTEEQKVALFNSCPFQSLLEWVPTPETIRCG